MRQSEGYGVAKGERARFELVLIVIKKWRRGFVTVWKNQETECTDPRTTNGASTTNWYRQRCKTSLT